MLTRIFDFFVKARVGRRWNWPKRWGKKTMIGAYEEFSSIPSLKTTVKLADVFNIELCHLVKVDLEKQARARSQMDSKAARDALNSTDLSLMKTKNGDKN